MECKATKLLFYALSCLSKKINLSFRMQARPQKGLGTDFHLGQRPELLPVSIGKGLQNITWELPFCGNAQGSLTLDVRRDTTPGEQLACKHRWARKHMGFLSSQQNCELLLITIPSLQIPQFTFCLQ